MSSYHVQHVCPYCGKRFVGKPNQRFCSNACRVGAHRRRKKKEKPDA